MYALQTWEERLKIWNVLIPSATNNRSQSLSSLNKSSPTQSTLSQIITEDNPSNNSPDVPFFKQNNIDPCFICMGDFNIQLVKPPEGKLWAKTSCRLRLNTMLNALKITPVPMFMASKGLTGTRGNSVLDYICVPIDWFTSIKEFTITPFSCSDHTLLDVQIMCRQNTSAGPPYWRFKNELLADELYINNMTQLLKDEIASLRDDTDLLYYWDSLKLKCVTFSKTFWRQHKSRILGTDNENHAKFTKPQKINFLKDPVSGTIVSDDRAISEIMVKYYRDLYTPLDSTPYPSPNMTFGLPHIPDSLADTLTEEFDLPEMEKALAKMKPGRAPGCDGITMEFYSKFWSLLGNILLRWANLIIKEGHLKGTASLGVITLIRKAGDPRDITNWRPINLITVDTKIILKTIANRLMVVMDYIIPKQQNALPGRSIFNALSVIRDKIALSRKLKIPIHILSLDQSKAFDRVNHGFLFHLLTIIGLPSFMLRAIKAFYTGFQCCIKNSTYLTNTFPYSRGIRQGDPMATALYALALQPALNIISLVTNTGVSDQKMNIDTLITAYADDVTIMTSDESLIVPIIDSFQAISKFSEATLNLNKSTVVSFFTKINAKDDQQRYQQTGIPRVHGYVKVLGVLFTPNDRIHTDQWERTIQSTKEQIVMSMCVLKKMSYSQRANWINRKLWPRWAFIFKVYQPTKSQMKQLALNFLEAIWLGAKHWLPEEVVTRPLAAGGINMMSIASRVDTFRVRHASLCFTLETYSLQHQLLKRNLDLYIDAGIGDLLLLTRPDSSFISDLPIHYQATYTAWHKLSLVYMPHSKEKLYGLPSFDAKPLHEIEPAFGLTASQAKSYKTFTIQQFLDFKPQIITRNYEKLLCAFRLFIDKWEPTPVPDCLCKSLSQEASQPSQSIPLVLWQNIPPFYLRCGEDVIHVCSWKNKIIYRNLFDTGEWQEINGISSNTWMILEKSFIPSPLKNRFWRFLHGKVTTSKYFWDTNVITSPECALCKEYDLSLQHQFSECKKLCLLKQSLSEDLAVLGFEVNTQFLQLIEESTPEAQLANLLTAVYVYTILETVRILVNNQRMIASRVNIRDTYYSVLAKHITIQATIKPFTNISNTKLWKTLTVGSLLAKFDKNDLYIRSKHGYLPFQTLVEIMDRG